MEREKEKKTIEWMIRFYCRKNHKSRELCGECAALYEYALLRLSRCPHGDGKPFCSNCKIRCYKPDMKAAIAKVMRFSGPRMLFYHPYAAILHLLAIKKERKNNKSIGGA
ncbi:MAG: nitrous oxide-stimulated promoter family protein [Clostridiales bacterium]|jgi:hypothetical protein|nr:nitrous oxide-stimulated promoter family protein [Clostridiales bacterium]